MKNFQVTSKEDGKKYWISRAICVVGVIQVWKVGNKFSVSSVDSDSRRYFLVSKRGPGCPDYVGKWQCTCGYLDWDETVGDAVVREIKEEIGLDLKEAVKETSDAPAGIFNFQLMEIIDDPARDDRQNVSFRYLIDLNYDWVQKQIEEGKISVGSEERGGENDEVSEIKLIPAEDIDKYEWAFNHYELLESIVKPGSKDKICH